LTPAASILNEVLRSLLIRNIDRLWQEHLLSIDHLRTEVFLRAVGQKDPLQEFKHEAFALFDSLSLKIKLEIAHAVFKFEMVAPPAAQPAKEVQQKIERLQHRTNLSLIPEMETEETT
jgi:preprotein translocase subunit SecA